MPVSQATQFARRTISSAICRHNVGHVSNVPENKHGDIVLHENVTGSGQVVAKVSPVNRKGSLSLADKEPLKERVKGIGPSPKAWEAFVLPLNYTRGEQ